MRHQLDQPIGSSDSTISWLSCSTITLACTRIDSNVRIEHGVYMVLLLACDTVSMYALCPCQQLTVYIILHTFNACLLNCHQLKLLKNVGSFPYCSAWGGGAVCQGGTVGLDVTPIPNDELTEANANNCWRQ
jgi:hypothetical protein